MMTIGFVVSEIILLTVIVIDEVVVLPAASRAVVVIVCVPLEAEVVFQLVEYGEAVSSVFKFTPSSLNWTPATPMLSLAVAEMVIVPETVVPPVGEVREMAGAIVSEVGDGAVGVPPNS